MISTVLFSNFEEPRLSIFPKETFFTPTLAIGLCEDIRP